MRTDGASEALVERIDAALPQLQCRRCGYGACRPYAEAVAQGRAAINRCPPGGTETIRALAGLLEVTALEPDPECGMHTPGRVAVIDEPWCIGCTLCIRACPVDAIVGAAKLMHCVIADECTGCELCIAPCPTGCISMREAAPSSPLPEWTRERSERARRRYHARARRLERSGADEMRERRRALRLATPESKRRAIRQSVRRVRGEPD